jgi:hypothetical protein
VREAKVDQYRRNGDQRELKVDRGVVMGDQGEVTGDRGELMGDQCVLKGGLATLKSGRATASASFLAPIPRGLPLARKARWALPRDGSSDAGKGR